MRFFFRCVAEAVCENGLKGLADMVPGGKFAYDVADGVWKKYRERRKEGEQREELAKLAHATLEEAKAEAAVVAPEVAIDAADDIIDLELYLTAIPDAVRQSLKRPEDPSGTTVPPTFALKSADDVLKLLPPRAPRFRPGVPLPGMAGWVLDRLLGTGGFGEVWYARHARMGSLSGAVKFCFGQSGQDLIHEAELIDRIMAAGKHPNILPLTHAHLEGDCPWLMFEYVGGGTLTDWIHQLAGKPQEQRLKQATAALTQLCEAVGHFHALPVPVVHRDLKPSNILLDRTTKKLRITDFGIGSVTARETNKQESRGGGTRGGRLLTYLRGSYTPLYSSPQQRSGSDPDPRDDVHALGVIAYQMLTGHLAQGAGPDFAEDLRDAGAGEELISLLGRCVAQKPERRPKDAGEVGKQLRSSSMTDQVVLLQPDHPQLPVANLLPPLQSQQPSQRTARVSKASPTAPPLVDEQIRRESEELYELQLRGVGTRSFLEAYAPTRLADWLAASICGDPDAMKLVGDCFYYGVEEEASVVDAMKWYRDAAKAGNAGAMNSLGSASAVGSEIEDSAKAVRWFRRAADLGHAIAMCNLGYAYDYGRGVQKNAAEAINWYRKAAELGVEAAKTAIKRLGVTAG